MTNEMTQQSIQLDVLEAFKNGGLFRRAHALEAIQLRLFCKLYAPRLGLWCASTSKSWLCQSMLPVTGRIGLRDGLVLQHPSTRTLED